MSQAFGPEPWRRRRLPNWKRVTAPTAVISLPINGFSATVGVPVTLDPTNTTDPDDQWQGVWTVTGPGAVVRFTASGTFGDFASHVKSWTPTIAEGVTVDFTVTDQAGQQSSAQVTGNVVPAGVPKIVFTTQPSASAQNGVNFGQVPVLQLRDANNNNLAIAGVQIIVTSSAGALAMSPQPIVTDANGQASPSSIKITGAVGNYTISAGATGYTGATSNAIALTPGPIVTAQCTASVPAGTTGVATTIVITARDQSGNALTTGGETFAVAVTGANTNSGNAIDNGNGTYTRQYTPTNAGSDSVAITRSAAHISGSPFTSVVSSPSALYANRFAGHTTVFETDWRQDPTPEPSAGSSEGWSDFGSGNHSFITSSGSIVTSAPVSNDSVLTCRYPANQNKGTAVVRLSWQNPFPANTGWLYSVAWVYIPANVTWNGNPLGKIQFLRDGQNNHYWGFFGESMRPMIGFQFTVEEEQIRSAGGLSRDTWHKLEIRGEPNTPGTRNGVCRMWIDGTEQSLSSTRSGTTPSVGRTDVLWWKAGQSAAWTGLFADMIYGGNAFNSPNFEMLLHYDRWYMAVK